MRASSGLCLVRVLVARRPVDSHLLLLREVLCGTYNKGVSKWVPVVGDGENETYTRKRRGSIDVKGESRDSLGRNYEQIFVFKSINLKKRNHM